MRRLSDSALIVFLKNFRSGQVKTRMAQTMGDEQALKIYRHLCDYTITEVRHSGLAAWFYFSGYIDDAFLNRLQVELNQDKYLADVQSGDNLGDRMQRAFEQTLTQFDRAMIIGTDCPYLDRESIRKAMAILESGDVDVILGPAIDGGYYALGMNQPYDLFQGINWSSGQEAEQTIQRCQRLELRYELLPELSDVDYESDWQAFQASTAFAHFQEVIRSSSSRNETDGL